MSPETAGQLRDWLTFFLLSPFETRLPCSRTIPQGHTLSSAASVRPVNGSCPGRCLPTFN